MPAADRLFSLRALGREDRSLAFPVLLPFPTLTIARSVVETVVCKVFAATESRSSGWRPSPRSPELCGDNMTTEAPRAFPTILVLPAHGLILLLFCLQKAEQVRTDGRSPCRPTR